MLAFAQVGRALELALRAAAPPALALVLAGIVLGWLGRTAPSLPFVALALPIRACLGIVLVLLSSGRLGRDPRRRLGHAPLGTLTHRSTPVRAAYCDIRNEASHVRGPDAAPVEAAPATGAASRGRSRTARS